jgi:hypothetical protein
MAKPIEMDAAFDEKLVDESIKIVCEAPAVMRCLAQLVEQRSFFWYYWFSIHQHLRLEIL